MADRIEFVEGRLTDLKACHDGQFDLVVSFDAPVSYTYPRHEEVLRDLVRIAGKAVVVSVSSRMDSLPYLYNPAQKLQYLVDEHDPDPAVQWYVRHGQAQLEGWRRAFDLFDRVLEGGCSKSPIRYLTGWPGAGRPGPLHPAAVSEAPALHAGVPGAVPRPMLYVRPPAVRLRPRQGQPGGIRQETWLMHDPYTRRSPHMRVWSVFEKCRSGFVSGRVSPWQAAMLFCSISASAH